jgi:hypothetical protein
MRIRSIKPEFWTSEDIAALDWPTRLLFVGLWSYVDDNGVGRDNEKLIKADLFPLEENPRDTLASVSRGLQALCDGGQIARYTVEDKPFLYVNAWEAHQRIDRPNKARYPLPTCGNAIPRDTLASVSRVSRADVASGAGEQRSRGTEEQGTSGTAIAHSRSSTDGFDAFWNAYGKKVDRAKAERKYALALKKPGVTADLLIAAAAEYVAYEIANNEGGRFIAHPSTWLHGERWRDERSGRQQPQTRVQQHLALAQQLAAEDSNHLEIGDGR